MKNTQIITARYIGVTNTKGARVAIVDSHFNSRIVLNRDYSLDYDLQVVKWLEKRGYTIHSKGLLKPDNTILAVTHTKGHFRDILAY